jgi:glycosyltransferase involved in cell wall biosynthesis
MAQTVAMQRPEPAQRLKVLMLTEYPYRPEDERLGGIMQASFRLVAGLDALADPRLELYVLTQSPHVDTRVVRRLEGGTTVLYYPLQRRLGNALLFGYPSVHSAVREAIQEFDPALIHGQGTAKYIYAATHSGRPHVVTVHGIQQNEMRVVRSSLTLGERIARIVKIRLERYYVSRIENLIAITDEVATFVRSYAPRVRIFPIHNAIDDRFFGITPLRPGQPPAILFVAAITYRKGLDYLLAAFQDVLVRVPEAKLRIAGIWDWDPKYVQRLRDEYAELVAAGKVAFLGGISQEQLIQEMQNATLLCLPSRAESAPMVISQAMAAARPVVASRVGGVPGMIRDGVEGRLWDVGDVRRLADLLVQTLEDFASSQVIAQAARSSASRRYSTRAVASQTVDAYLSAWTAAHER